MDDQRKKLIKTVEETWGLFRGKKEFLKHLKEKPLTHKESLLANCYHCAGGYDGGSFDCKSEVCPAYQFMPYREEKPKKTSGKPKKVLSEKHLEALKVGREKKAEEKSKNSLQGSKSK